MLHDQTGQAVAISDFKGKVVYLYCFQSWCPGCHKHGFPTLQAVKTHYAEAKDVVFVVMQTVFEGFETNTFERGQEVLKKFELDLPYAMSGNTEKRSEIMRAYNTGGTPWTILIDREGTAAGHGLGPMIGIESDRLRECVEEYHRGQFVGVFGSSAWGFRESSLHMLAELRNLRELP